MFVCQWHLDVPFGRQGEALRILSAWRDEKLVSSEFKRAKAARVLVGHVGVSASHIIEEYVFESLADLEAGLQGMSGPQFVSQAGALAPLVVPGSQRWEILRIVD